MVCLLYFRLSSYVYAHRQVLFGKMSIFALLSGNCTDLIKVLRKKRVLNALKGHLYHALPNKAQGTLQRVKELNNSLGKEG